MKKILLLIIVVVAYNNLFAFTTQGNWRWRKDDGSETTATWLAAENTAPEISNPSEVLRLRIVLYNDPNNAGGLLDGALFEDSSDAPGATWDTIKLSIGTNAFVLAGTSPNVTNLQATTDQLAGEGFPYVAGKIIVSSESLPAQTIQKGRETEYEYCIKPTANLQPGRTYYFRVDAANYPATKTLPSLVTAAVLPIKLASFEVKPDGKHVKVEWATASEQNNDRFEVEKSSDGRVWTTIATVKGNGTTTQPHSYNAFDNLPLKGMNYYRIKQYDLNGKYVVSDVRSLKMFIENNSLVSVYPNPSKGIINFSLGNYSGSNVSAALTNSNGKIIHREIIKEIQANTTYTLGVKQQPAPGIYFLQLKAEGLSETVKIVVQ